HRKISAPPRLCGEKTRRRQATLLLSFNNDPLKRPQLRQREVYRAILPTEINAPFVRHRPNPRRFEVRSNRKIYRPHRQRFEIGIAAEAGEVYQVNDHSVGLLASVILRDV